MKIHEFAKQLSHKLHAGVFRNDGKTPYTVHTDYVGDNVHRNYVPAQSSNMDIARAVGYGHDILEDCNITVEALLDAGIEYGNDWRIVVDNIVLLSRFSKDEHIMTYLNRIKQSIVAKAVKLTDLEHNLSDLKSGNLRDKYHLCQYILNN